MSLSPEELTQFAVDLAASPDGWREMVRHSSESRLYEQIWDAEEVNAWLICWCDGQDTGFHDHDDSAAAILGLQGTVQEERLRLGAAPQAHVIEDGNVIFVPSTAIHRVRHIGTAPAVTIHAYSPPLQRTGAYRVGQSGQLERLAQSFEQELRAETVLA